MLDAAQNHSASVVIVDELRNAREVDSARTIAHQGETLIARMRITSLAQKAAEGLHRKSQTLRVHQTLPTKGQGQRNCK